MALNAKEAYTQATDNKEEVTTRETKARIAQLTHLVEHAVKEGEFYTSVPAFQKWGVDERVAEHFTNLGFEVEITSSTSRYGYIQTPQIKLYWNQKENN